MQALPVRPDDVQVMLRDEPAAQFSPPLGEVTAIAAPATIEKSASLTSLTAAFEASLIRIRAWIEGVFGTVQV